MSKKPPPSQPENPATGTSKRESALIQRAAQDELKTIDALAYREERSLSRHERLEDAKRQFKLKEAKDVHSSRLGYLRKLFWLIVGWLVSVVAFVG